LRSKSIKPLILLAFLSISFGQEIFAELEVNDAWIRSAPPNSKIFSGYLKFKNVSSNEIMIKKMKSNAFDQIEIHSSFIEDGISTMRKMDSLRIPENSEVTLDPGSYHLMLMNPIKEIKEGNLVEMIIYYEVEDRIKILRSDAIVLRDGYE
tara:strand:- start:5769 stop:6221 length:453 start_codon:yes stop_codon:yes gene_type:complete